MNKPKWTRAGVRHRGGRWYYLRLRGDPSDGWQPVQLAYDPHQILSGLRVGPRVDAFLNGKWSEWGALVLQGYERSVQPIKEPA